MLRSDFPETVLTGPRLKLFRADEHIQELRSAINPLREDLYFFGVKTQHRMGSGAVNSLTYEPKKPVARVLSLMIGDAIHNLRASLDHFATNVVRKVDPKAKPYFPMSRSREHLETSPSLNQLEKALPGARKVVLETLRPPDDPGQRYWEMLQAFDIVDKHSLVIPNVTIVRFYGFTFSSGSTAFQDISAGGSAERTLRPFSSTGPFNYTGSGKPQVKLVFPEGGPVAGEAVVPALESARELVSQALTAFEPLLSDQ